MKIIEHQTRYLELLEKHKPNITYSQGRRLVYIESHNNKIWVWGKTYSHTFKLWKDKIEDCEDDT